jgi:ribosomal protein S18 acetylase RimI-like enzyme
MAPSIGQNLGVVSIRRTVADDSEACIAVLSRLPEYFTPNTHDEVRKALVEEVAWVATDVGEIQGFLIVEARYTFAAEITFAAVLPELRRSGIGSQLVAAAIGYLRAKGMAVVEVKTLDSSAGYEPYIATRAFWERMGFMQIDCIDPLPGWQPGNPSAIYVASLTTSRP